MKLIILWISLFFISNVYAANINAPPPLQDAPVELQAYLNEIYRNFHKLEITTTNPDGVRTEKKGHCLILQTGGSSYLECNTDSSNTWRGVILTDVP